MKNVKKYTCIEVGSNKFDALKIEKQKKLKSKIMLRTIIESKHTNFLKKSTKDSLKISLKHHKSTGYYKKR